MMECICGAKYYWRHRFQRHIKECDKAQEANPVASMFMTLDAMGIKISSRYGGHKETRQAAFNFDGNDDVDVTADIDGGIDGD